MGKAVKRGTCGQHVDSKRPQRVGYISIHVATLDLPKDPTVGWHNGGGVTLIWHRSDCHRFQKCRVFPKTSQFRPNLGARLGERLNANIFWKQRASVASGRAAWRAFRRRISSCMGRESRAGLGGRTLILTLTSYLTLALQP